MSAARRPLIAGNWKMNGTIARARELISQLRAIEMPAGVEVVVAPPFTALAAAAQALAGSTIALGAQTMHEGDAGAFTGEISAPMLLELGVSYVILGHSERRLACNESDRSVNRKVVAALAAGLLPIVAVGETEAEHATGRTRERVVSQTRAAFDGVAPGDVARAVVAYEPIWAIGTGKNDEPESANRVIGDIRASVAGLENARLLYGGSMKPGNAAALLAQPEIDGGLIGGASLVAADFAAIVAAARERVAA